MEKLKGNPLFHSISSRSTNKFRNIMNSPNFGNQQILLQSCCFFDSDQSQTPHTSDTINKEFAVKNKNISGSPKITYSNGNINSFKKFHLLTDNYTQNNNPNMNINIKEEKTITKLKNDNKALKQTIKNLTSQLDRVCNIALKAKNSEMNTIQKNNSNEQEKNNLLNEIEILKKEKNSLKVEIEKKDEEYNKYNKTKIINKEKKNRKFNTEIRNEFENLRQANSINFSSYKDINESKQYKLEINKLKAEKDLLKNKNEEQNNLLNKKEKYIQDLLNENLSLKNNLKFLRKKSPDNEEINIMINKDEKKELIKENMDLSNKLIKARKTITEYIEKYDEVSKKYFNLKNLSKKLEKENNDLNAQLSIENSKEENSKMKINYNMLQ